MAAERIIMSYATLRGPGDSPLTQHMHESPNVSPCRDCEFRSADKNEHPACINCLKLHYFRTIPVNIGIRHDLDTPKPRKVRHYEPVSRKKIPAGTMCSVPGCDKPARYQFFKDIYQDHLCNNHYLKIYRRHKRTGSIYDKEGNL